MFEKEVTDCAQHIANSLRDQTVSANQIRVVCQDDTNLLLFYWFSPVDNLTFIGCYYLVMKQPMRARSATLESVDEGNVALNNALILCQLKGQVDIVHMSTDKELHLLAVVYTTHLPDGTVFYNVDLIDVSSQVSLLSTLCLWS